MSEVHAARRERLRERLGTAGVDAALVTRAANVRYLTGCAPVGGVLLLTQGRQMLALPEGLPPGSAGTRYELEDLERVDVPPGADPAVTAAAACAWLGVRALGVEEHDLTVRRHRTVALAAHPAQARDLDRVVEQLRVVKDDDELSGLRIASEIADQALGELLESILVGRTERHLAMELERRMVDHGADGPAFPTSVATGPHAGLPGHRPTDHRVEEGDFLTVSLGARYRGYGTSVARTFVIGSAPAQWQIDLHGLVFAAQRAGREALVPGASCSAAHEAAAEVLRRAGLPEPSPSPLGHGVGLETAEDPQLGPDDMGKLGARVPVTVGPGVHLPGRGGVRIEDTLVVRPLAEGGPELLTITTKELLAL